MIEHETNSNQDLRKRKKSSDSSNFASISLYRGVIGVVCLHGNQLVCVLDHFRFGNYYF